LYGETGGDEEVVTISPVYEKIIYSRNAHTKNTPNAAGKNPTKFRMNVIIVNIAKSIITRSRGP
jgi:hypothetical protein